MSNTMRLGIVMCLFLFGVVVNAQSGLKTATATANFPEDTFKYGTCSCLQNYICTSSSAWKGIALFNDPIPPNIDVTITEVKVEMTGDPFCNSAGSTNSFKLNLALNEVSLRSLQDSGTYNCYCHCRTVSNSTSFSNGLPNYVRGGTNSIKTTVSSSTVACFQGYQVTLSYYENKPNSPSPLPLPSSSPSPSPSRKGDTTTSPYTCCIYAGGPGGAYDVTCTPNGVCNAQVGYTFITKYPVQSCNECFNE